MKPYPFRNLNVEQRVYNYRLSRARRVVENAFGIASARFRVLRRTSELQPDRVRSIVNAICVLHNFLLSRGSRQLYAPPGTFDSGTENNGQWRQESPMQFNPLQVAPRGSTLAAKQIQVEYLQYFCNEGQVPWQTI